MNPPTAVSRKAEHVKHMLLSKNFHLQRERIKNIRSYLFIEELRNILSER